MVIVDSAMDATMTIEVADENPPKNAKVAKLYCPCDSGTVKTNKSGLAFAGNVDKPAIAIGKTNRLIKNRYNGKAQLAVARCFSSSFSTTIT